MKRIIRILLFVSLFAYASENVAAQDANILAAKPYLQNPVGEGITVSWITGCRTYSWVMYGTDPNRLTQKAHTIVDGQVICNNLVHKIRLQNLTPGVTYYYRAYSKEFLEYHAYSKSFGKTDSSDVYSFTLPKADQTDFTAIIFNDLHKHDATFEALYNQVKNIKYDFVIFNGDCIDDPENASQVFYYLKLYNETIGAEKVPVFYFRGNHEIRNSYSIEMRNFFDYVGDKTYSAFNWGDTRFVQLDCGEDKPDTTPVYYGLNDFSGLRNDQVDFLKQELKSKAFKKAKKRVVIHHIPIYGNGDAYNPCFELWNGLLKKKPFNVSINAHTHSFVCHEAGSKYGNTYPVVIGGGPSMEGASILILQKHGKTMTIRALNTQGKELLNKEL